MKKSVYLLCLSFTALLLACAPKTETVSLLPANPNATLGAKNLFAKLAESTKTGIMIGHQDALLYGNSWKSEGIPDVKQVCGDYPAVFGWELGDLELGNSASLDSVDFSEIAAGMKWVHANGGINTVSWHANNPLTGGNSWDVTNDQVVKSLLPNGESHDRFMKMLEQMADFFLQLTDADGELIPFIFRPYHEHTGSWFWWGQNLCTTADYVAMWQLTVGYFHERGLNNILYAYSSAGNIQNADEYLERYPGDELIDLVGFDTYQRSVEQRDQYIASVTNGLGIVVPIANERNKIAILAETGFESVPDPEWWTKTIWPAIEQSPIAYVLFWRNAHDQPNHYYATFPGQVSADDFVAFKNIERTLFLSDIQ